MLRATAMLAGSDMTASRGAERREEKVEQGHYDGGGLLNCRDVGCAAQDLKPGTAAPQRRQGAWLRPCRRLRICELLELLRWHHAFAFAWPGRIERSFAVG